MAKCCGSFEKYIILNPLCGISVFIENKKLKYPQCHSPEGCETSLVVSSGTAHRIIGDPTTPSPTLNTESQAGKQWGQFYSFWFSLGGTVEQ